MGEASEVVRVEATVLDGFCRAVLAAAGADAATQDAATRAMLHGSRLGVDSHGVRLLPHYTRAIRGGRVNGAPALAVRRTGAVATLDADDAHGARATYAAMDEAVALARSFGVGAVAVRRSSHFGPAGTYALAAAEAGLIGFATCNSDAFVRLHDGASRFHGTNPLAFAAPVAGERPYLVDMATSAIPHNRVLLYRSLGVRLPEGVASDVAGVDTLDPHDVEMLAPVGGAFGHKGAALAGVAEVLSAVLPAMRLSAEILPMGGPDFATPRQLGAFVLALDPAAFGQDAFADEMARYLAVLRASPAREGARVMAPGDREWAEADRRDRDGLPVDPASATAFRTLAAEAGIPSPL